MLHIPREKSGALPRRACARAFTFIEMLCVILVLAIAASIAVAMLGSNGGLKISAAARMLATDCAFAQNRAIARQGAEYVVFDTSRQTYSIEEGSPLAVMTNPVTLQPYTSTMGPGSSDNTSIISVSFDNKTVLAYDEAGIPYSYDATTGTKTSLVAGVIKLGCEGFTTTLTVQPNTGELVVSTP